MPKIFASYYFNLQKAFIECALYSNFY